MQEERQVGCALCPAAGAAKAVGLDGKRVDAEPICRMCFARILAVEMDLADTGFYAPRLILRHRYFAQMPSYDVAAETVPEDLDVLVPVPLPAIELGISPPTEADYRNRCSGPPLTASRKCEVATYTEFPYAWPTGEPSAKRRRTCTAAEGRS